MEGADHPKCCLPGIMKFITWNVRGLGCDKKNALIYQTIIEQKPEFICLQETKLANINNFTASTFLPPCYRNFFFQPTEGTAGGLLTSWNNHSFSASLNSASATHLSVSFCSSSDNTSFSIINVYAPCDDHARLLFFDHLSLVTANLDDPFMLLGDFNIYRYPYEKNNDNIN